MSSIIGTISAMGFDSQDAGISGWLFCDGSAVSRTSYAALFDAIGTAWGAGDGTTTFNLPDLRGNFLRGVDDGARRDPNSATRLASNAGGNAGDNVGSGQACATALPACGSLATSTDGAHAHAIQHLPTDSSYYQIAGTHYAAWNSGSTSTSADGNHSHACGRGNNNGTGGDAESRAVNVYADYMIFAGPASAPQPRAGAAAVPQGDYPLGAVLPFAGTINEATLQSLGWLYCNGNTVSRTTQADLFAAIGTAYGDGDGVSTFNLPDFRGCFQRGVNGLASNDPNAADRTACAPGGNTGNAIGSAQGFATGQPTKSMTTSSAGSHSHTAYNIPNDSSSGAVAGSYQCIWNGDSANTDSQGNHAHAMNAGGDAETRPLNIYAYFIVKAQQV